MFLFRPFAVMLSSSLPAGCAVGSDYYRPAAPLAKRYIAESSLLNRSASQPDNFANWWEEFNDPLLTKIVTDTLPQNIYLAQAIARMTQSRAGLGATGWAPSWKQGAEMRPTCHSCITIRPPDVQPQ